MTGVRVMEKTTASGIPLPVEHFPGWNNGFSSEPGERFFHRAYIINDHAWIGFLEALDGWTQKRCWQ